MTVCEAQHKWPDASQRSGPVCVACASVISEYGSYYYWWYGYHPPDAAMHP
jgi:hypothetical protein